MSREPVLFAWSGGKDSMLALHALQEGGAHEVVSLLTTMNGEHDRVTMHGVRRELLVAQADSLGLPLSTVEISGRSSHDEYRERMSTTLLGFRSRGIRTVVHGDVFLADVREYRERLLHGVGMSALFPLWGESTRELAVRFETLGYRAVATCVDTHALDPGFAGREYGESFLRDLPASVDPGGENGEFHTFVYDGPLFVRPIPLRLGDVVIRDERFAFRELLPDVVRDA